MRRDLLLLVALLARKFPDLRNILRVHRKTDPPIHHIVRSGLSRHKFLGDRCLHGLRDGRAWHRSARWRKWSRTGFRRAMLVVIRIWRLGYGCRELWIANRGAALIARLQ